MRRPEPRRSAEPTDGVGRSLAALLACLSVLAASAPLRAQEALRYGVPHDARHAPSTAVTRVRLAVDLAADPHGTGPTAWRLLRDRLAGGRAAGAPDADSELSIGLSFDEHGAVRLESIRSGPALPGHLYMHGVLEVEEDGTRWRVEGDCTPGGHARAELVEGPHDRMPRAVARLVEILEVEPSSVLVDLQVPALCGAVAAPGGGLGVAATPQDLVAVWCGATDVLVRAQRDGPRDGVHFAAVGEGGFLLPAALLVRAAPAIADRLAAHPAERLALRASLGGLTRRPEAALELGLFLDAHDEGDPEAEEARHVLQHLAAFGEGDTRAAAAVAGARAVARAPVVRNDAGDVDVAGRSGGTDASAGGWSRVHRTILWLLLSGIAATLVGILRAARTG